MKVNRAAEVGSRVLREKMARLEAELDAAQGQSATVETALAAAEDLIAQLEAENATLRKRSGHQVADDGDQVAAVGAVSGQPQRVKRESIPPRDRPAFVVSAKHKKSLDVYVLLDVRGEVRSVMGPFSREQIADGAWRSAGLSWSDGQWARDQEWEYLDEIEQLFPSLMNEGRRIGNEVVDSKGYHVLRRQWELGWSFQMFFGNAQELIHFLDALSSHRFPAQWISKSNQGIVFGYIVRMLHNFVASAMALKDHCGHVYLKKHYPDKNHPFRVLYADTLGKKSDENALWAFMQGLRNYTLHKELPSVSLQMKMASPQDRLELTIQLDVNRLREWDDWKSGARRYLSKLPEKISLIGLVEEYTQLVVEFYEWFIAAERDQHSDDISTFERLRQQMCSVFDLGSLPISDLNYLFGFWAAPATWLPEIEDKKKRAVQYRRDVYQGLVKALHAVIEGTVTTSLPPSEFVAAMGVAAMARAPGKTSFSLSMADPVYLDEILAAQAELARMTQKNQASKRDPGRDATPEP